MKDREFIDKILALLVERFGADAIIHLVDARYKSNTTDSGSFRSKGRSRRTALQIVASEELTNDTQRSIIEVLAERFDDHSFLPTIGDVKAFLDLHHYSGKPPKSRAESFLPILAVLKNCSISDLQVIRTNEVSAGISELGPLADAIRTAGDSLRGQETLDLPEAPDSGPARS